ncbi:alpha-ketoglutarate-dependent dioxygenase AlkB family protein [Vibrio sp. SCSIO 43137]|uniref:alpha-ketoglutarate-dependent dioxygenase AlkB family protein n=1 Tax=Vibrio sp. SCSIO 43137 TaxID=3021011 RepID=UPI0023076101|nr:alpha-ketoglutarate-dependent dioxygenase AlkB [Vibrio sp. SCSIO 43137]WCE32010.1 alpha-ketoglutarate-dependent dioxygenase AlkB [Vibrio sp. SCSIO 43137]
MTQDLLCEKTGWIELTDSKIYWQPNFLSEELSEHLFHQLLNSLNWKQEKIQMFGRQVLQPRLQAWHGTKCYTYSGLTMQPEPWTEPLSVIRQACELVAGQEFNSVLANLYRDGNDSMGWHQDNEKELGHQPVIASVSLGESRRFLLRNKLSGEKHEWLLNSGSLLIMAGNTQNDWQHSVPKTKKAKGNRINLTYRHIVN